jgi:hypothetical protein
MAISWTPSKPQKAFSQNFFLVSCGGVRLCSLGTAATTGLQYQPQMIDDGDCGAIGGMKIDRGNLSIGRKPAPVPLCQPQIPHDLTWARTRAAAVGSQRLTAWAMARTSTNLGFVIFVAPQLFQYINTAGSQHVQRTDRKFSSAVSVKHIRKF